MDIRNFFSAKRKVSSTSSNSTDDKSRKKSKVISDSDDESPLPPSKKSRILASDSEDETIVKKSQSPKPKHDASKKKKSSSKEESKLKATSADDFFSSSKSSSTPKRSRVTEENNDFEKTLKQLDEKSKKPKIEKPKEKKSYSKDLEKSQNENSPPNKGLASKLAEKAKAMKNTELKVTESKDIPKESIASYKIPKISKSEIKSEVKSEIKSEVKSPEKKKDDSKLKDKKTSSKAKKNEKSYDIEIEKKSPNKTKTKSENESNDSMNESLNDSIIEKKKSNAAAYKKFLSRAGPKNPGSKIIPDGAPGCLNGITFVMTGVMDSLDRVEATELIKKYGGKVTTSLSKNTSYLLIGDEPGESKIAKAEILKTKTLDEDGLLDMIRKSVKDSNKVITEKKSEKTNSEKKSPSKSRDSTSSSSTRDSPSSSGKSSLYSSQFSESPKTSSQISSKSSMSSPSSTSSSPKTLSLSSQEISSRSQETLMWVDKYKPATLKNIIGQQGNKSQANKLLFWLKNWSSNHDGTKKLTKPSPWAKDDNGAFFKAALLSGSPGVGKTTTAHLVCKEAGFDFVELNASDCRSKRSLEEDVSHLLFNTSLTNYVSADKSDVTTNNNVLVMDEVDGVAGNEDRGGVQELIALIKKSKVPIICMCNDRNHPKIRSLANHCFDLRFQKPRIEQIRGSMMSVCFKEGIKIKPDALDQIIIGANQDVRQVLHHLSLWSSNNKQLDSDDMKRESQKSKKEFKIGPWDVCRKVFSEGEQKNMNIHDKSGLFFQDYSIGPLFVQENYPKVVPHSAQGNRRKVLQQLAKTAQSLADGDLVERAIRSHQAWSLLPSQAIFSSVLPGEYMSGHLAGQIEFPSWLGNNSKKNKFDRLAQELQMHMRLKISGNKTDVSFDYCYPLKKRIVTPLIKQGLDGVKDSVEVMNTYDLLREDLDSLNELTTWSGQKDIMNSVETKVKSAFTRTFNKECHLSPYAATTVKKKGKIKSDDLLDEEETEEIEEDDSIESDAMVKIKKKDNKKGKSDQQGKGKGKGKSKT